MDPMQIYVQDPRGKKFTLGVEPSDTIDEVRNKIMDGQGVPKQNQRLTFE
jgi:hypothetical protein